MKFLLFLLISVSISCSEQPVINNCSETRPIAFDQHNSPLPVVYNKQTQSYEIKTKSHYTDYMVSVIGKLGATIALFKLVLFCYELSDLHTRNNPQLEKIANAGEWHRKLAVFVWGITFVSFLKTLQDGPAITEKVTVKEV